MNIILTVIAGLVLIDGAFILGFLLGTKYNRPPDRGRSAVPEPTEEEKKKAKLIMEGLKNMMNYDINVAMDRRLRDE